MSFALGYLAGVVSTLLVSYLLVLRVIWVVKRAEAELVQVRESAAAVREEAAQLRGQAEALKLQQGREARK